MADVEKLAQRTSDAWAKAIEELDELVTAMKESHPSVHEDYAAELHERAQTIQDDVEDMAHAIYGSHLDDEDLYGRLEDWGKL